MSGNRICPVIVNIIYQAVVIVVLFIILIFALKLSKSVRENYYQIARSIEMYNSALQRLDSMKVAIEKIDTIHHVTIKNMLYVQYKQNVDKLHNYSFDELAQYLSEQYNNYQTEHK